MLFISELFHFHLLDDDTVDISSIDFETRRVKERRAHEEILSGRFRHPNLAPSKRFSSKAGLVDLIDFISYFQN